MRDCVALDRAARIAKWVGGGKPLTSKGVLRPVDVRQAAGAVGVTVPAKLRSAADVLAWHLPWSVAVATGTVAVTAWIHAAYRHYLRLDPFPATPRPNWRWPVE